MTVRVLPVGDAALLVELDDGARAVALHADLGADPVPGVGEPVPGARTLLVPFRPGRIGAGDLERELRRRAAAGRAAPDGSAARTVEVPVVYDGADLPEVAAHLGWSVGELVRRHAAATWTVAFLGFAPGFGYLTSDDPDLVVPRRATPRTRVPAGSVALAGPFGGVYPRDNPGGWQLLGRTDAVLWDVDRPEPALWAPGDTVRFVPADADRVGTPRPGRHAGLPTRPRSTDPEPADPRPAGHRLEVVAAGPQALVQDLGRTGAARWGVSGSGAADPRSHRAAQRAVGNPPGTAGIEALGGGLRLRARGRVVVATAGASTATVHPADGGAPREVPPSSPVLLTDGDELALGVPRRGLRTSVAVRGGVDLPPVLGSLSTDLLAGLGPAPLAPGTVLPVAPAPGDTVGLHDGGAPDPHHLPAPGTTTELPVVPGPRDDWFTPEALAVLTAQEWEVTDAADRVGLRLRGAAPLTRTTDARDAELPSEACVTGALQVPPDGQPVLFGPDHPLTGGYPVVATVPTTHTWLLGQLPPGARLRFTVRPPR